MAIATAVEKNGYVFLYDERGAQIASIFANGGRLVGYTSGTVSIKAPIGWIFTYNERGMQINSVPGR